MDATRREISSRLLTLLLWFVIRKEKINITAYFAIQWLYVVVQLVVMVWGYPPGQIRSRSGVESTTCGWWII